jgi:hypothetical protein
MSFVILPPIIDSEGNNGVDWKNIFAFCAGVLSVVLYNHYKNKVNLKKKAVSILSVLVILVICYQLMYSQFSISVNCGDKMRVATSHSKMRPEAEVKYKYWKIHSQEPLVELLQSNDCSSIRIWRMSALFLPYYGIIAIYFGIIITFVLLLAVLIDLVGSNDYT